MKKAKIDPALRCVIEGDPHHVRMPSGQIVSTVDGETTDDVIGAIDIARQDPYYLIVPPNGSVPVHLTLYSDPDQFINQIIPESRVLLPVTVARAHIDPEYETAVRGRDGEIVWFKDPLEATMFIDEERDREVAENLDGAEEPLLAPEDEEGHDEEMEALPPLERPPYTWENGDEVVEGTPPLPDSPKEEG